MKRQTTITGAVLAAVIVIHAVILWWLGRIPWCECGLGFGTFSAWSSETSQHFIDPYSLSHILHGIIFYLILRYVIPKTSIQTRLILATLIEIGWEILENSPIIINRYRTATAALDYFGDSILNSIGDIVMIWIGFWIAWKLRWQWTLCIVIALELLMLYFYKDNLTLNIVMLLYPIEAIKEWQTAQ